MEVLTIPDMPILGTTFDLTKAVKTTSNEKLAAYKSKFRATRDEREEEGFGNRWTEKQQFLRPEFGNVLKVNFPIWRLR